MLIKLASMLFLLILLFSHTAYAYIDAVGSGLIFQVGYVVFAGLLAFLTLPLRKIANFFRRKKGEDNNPQERDKI